MGAGSGVAIISLSIFIFRRSDSAPSACKSVSPAGELALPVERLGALWHFYLLMASSRAVVSGVIAIATGVVISKWFIRKLASYLTGVKIPDLNSGLRAMRIEVARQFVHLLPPGFSCVTTITMAFLSNGYSIKYVPIERPKK